VEEGLKQEAEGEGEASGGLAEVELGSGELVRGFGAGRGARGSPDKGLEREMGKPTHLKVKAKAGGKEEVKEGQTTTAIEKAKENQEREMKEVKLGGCMGRTKYERAWREIGGLEVIRKGVVLIWNWWGPLGFRLWILNSIQKFLDLRIGSLLKIGSKNGYKSGSK
jgi:hypothetical protein